MEHLATHIGTNRKTLGQWENPRIEKMPQSITDLERWCHLLGFTLAEALSGEPLPDQEFFLNPQHQKEIRFFYNRYISDPNFASLLHKMMASDSETLHAINKLIETAAKLDTDAVDRMDRNWETQVWTRATKIDH